MPSTFAPLSLASALIVASVAPVLAANLADGEYLCSLSRTMQLGSIWITGNSYVGPSRDPNGEAHPYQLTESGTVNWGAPLGGMDTDGNRVLGTVLRDAGDGKIGFDIQFSTETGHTHVASCEPQF